MIDANFDENDILNYINEQLQNNINAIIETYKYVGETFVANARSKTADDGGFRDVTGNLRSSIGFILIRDGKQIFADFEEAGAGTDRATGKNEGSSFAKEVAQKYPTGIALICVAGMEYAAAVESRGKDVITGSTLNIENQLTTLLKN